MFAGGCPIPEMCFADCLGGFVDGGHFTAAALLRRCDGTLPHGPSLLHFSGTGEPRRRRAAGEGTPLRGAIRDLPEPTGPRAHQQRRREPSDTVPRLAGSAPESYTFIRRSSCCTA